MSDGAGELKDKVRALRADFDRELKAARDSSALQGLRDRYLGRKAGAVTALMKALGALAADARRQAGQDLNRLKDEVEQALETAKDSLESNLKEGRLARERVDITLPRPHPAPRPPPSPDRGPRGPGRHLPGHGLRDLRRARGGGRLPLLRGPQHAAGPSRPRHAGHVLPRGRRAAAPYAHLERTDPLHAEQPHPPDVRIICPGKVYRRDDDITHSPMFQQIEGLVVGKGITLGDLKGTIEAFLHALFGAQFPVRFRPSYFPYTEPSVEVDLGCVVCGGKGCRVCKQTGWLEIMGSGMVHPAVFEAVNARLGRVVYDPEEVTGFAFGLGIERVAMVRHGIDNIRLFYESDLRFLEQFPG
jgi:phenylalanyl-tRNA synthetase alpha chain